MSMANIPVIRPLENTDFLYKYIDREWVTGLIRHGQMRINTFNYFRKVEDARGDPGEGMVTKRWDSPEGATGLDLPPFGPVSAPKEGAATVTIRNVVITEKNSLSDGYVYCASSVLSSELMRRFGTDCVLRIERSRDMFSRIGGHLKELGIVEVDHGYAVHVHYRDRVVHHDEPAINIPACFVKPATYSMECEVRALWETSKDPISPVDITLPEIIQHFSVCTPA